MALDDLLSDVLGEPAPLRTSNRGEQQRDDNLQFRLDSVIDDLDIAENNARQFNNWIVWLRADVEFTERFYSAPDRLKSIAIKTVQRAGAATASIHSPTGARRAAKWRVRATDLAPHRTPSSMTMMRAPTGSLSNTWPGVVDADALSTTARAASAKSSLSSLPTL